MVNTDISLGGGFTPKVPTPLTKRLLDFTLGDHLRTLAGMATNPIKTLSAYQFTLPVFQYQLFGTHFTVVNDPDMIKHCFVDNAANYRLEPIRQSILTPVLRGGLVAVEGDRWRRARKVLAPIFTPRFTKNFAGRMHSALEDILPETFQDDGDVILAADKMSELAYQLLSETLFSGEINHDAAGMMSDVSDFFQFMGNVDPLDMLRAPSWVPRPTRLRGKAAVRRLRGRIGALTEDRMRRSENGEALPDDFLTRLIKAENDEKNPLTSDEIEDHILTFIAAGHETTARGLSWLLYLLAHDKDALRRAEAEVDAVDVEQIPAANWQSQLPYLTACFEEAMRLYPPAPFITRMAAEDDRYKLAFIPGGGYLFLNLYALHRHEIHWKDPGAFRPERFLGEAKKDIKRYQYLPFGVGHRICIGGHFAMQEAMIILTLLLRRYRFDYAADVPPTPVMRITLKPDNGVPMTVRRRTPEINHLHK